MPVQLDDILQRIASRGLEDREEHFRELLRGRKPHRIAPAVDIERAKGKAPNGEKFHIKLAASTTSVARDGGVVPLAAWENGGLRNFEANPVIQFAHDYHEPPIARSVFNELSREHGAMMQYWEFHEENELSRLMRALYERGFMRAASVGFIIHEIHFPSDEEIAAIQKQTGSDEDIWWVAVRAELLETSAVPVPADPRALVPVEHALSNGRASGLEINVLERALSSLRQRCSLGDTTACRSLHMPAQTETVETVAAPDAPDFEALLRASEERVNTLEASVAALTTRLDALEAQRVDDQEELRRAAEEEAVAGDEDDVEDGFEIELLDGETLDQAIDRVVNEQVRKLRGEPVPAKK